MGIVKTNNAIRKLEEPFSMGGHTKCSPQEFKGSSSYATGGDTLNASSFGVGHSAKIYGIIKTSDYTQSGTYLIRIKKSTSGGVSSIKVVFIVVATGAEVANGVDLSAEKFMLMGILVP